jgi:fumarate reductase flavoprotein subunit
MSENQDNISRRSFLKGAASGAAGLAAVGVLDACAPKIAAPTVTPEVPASKGTSDSAIAMDIASDAQIPSSPVDGKYITKAMGHEDYLYVRTDFKDGAITACSVVSHNETMGVGNFACSRIPAAILLNQSINVPNVRGCSTTSRAIKKAVEEAIRLSGYDLNQFQKEVVEEDNPTSEEITVDVVIMGAGTGGLACAAKLLDQGYSVKVIEKRPIPGGSMAMTYSGVQATGTETLNKFNVDGTLPESILSAAAKIDPLKAGVNPEVDRFGATLPYENTVYNVLGEVGEFYKSIGIGFMTLGSFEGGYQIGTGYTYAPGMYMGGAGYAMMALASRIERHPNGGIIYSTKVSELIQDKDTKQVTGLKAVGLKSDESENGYKLTVHAKAVVLASGGFAKNKEMLAEYYPEQKDLFFNCASESTGDGIQLGLTAGSKMECTDRHNPGFLSSSTFFELAFIHFSVPGIMVNSFGKSVGNIWLGNHAKMATLAQDKTQGDAFYYVFDELGVPLLKDWEMFNMTTYKALFDRGEVLYYKTVEEAATALQLDDLQASIDANNKASLANEADEFGRKNCPFIETRAGIYLVKTTPTMYLTTGGLCIDPQGHVLTDSYVSNGENSVIPGLYACGDVCGSLEEKDGRVYSYGCDMATGMGFQVAKTIEADEVEISAQS